MKTLIRCFLVLTIFAIALPMGATAQEEALEAGLQCDWVDVAEESLPDLDLVKVEMAGGSCPGLCLCGSCCQCPRRSNTGSCCADGGCTTQGDPICLAVSQCTCISTDPEE